MLREALVDLFRRRVTLAPDLMRGAGFELPNFDAARFERINIAELLEDDDMVASGAMPSVLHEALVDLFRHRVTLAPDLVENVLDVDLPSYTEARVEEANLTQIVPTEYNADLVVLLANGTPVAGIVVEVQLGRDPDKSYSWPLYAAALRAKIRCPVSVLVIAPDASVAAWASDPIIIGPPGSVFRPLVLGPQAVPWVTDTEEAAKAPELAVLSALAHGNENHGLDVVHAALTATSTLDEDRAALYADLVMVSLHEAVAEELKAMVATGKYEYQSDFAKKYFADGEAKGRAAMLLRVLDRRGLEFTAEQRERVNQCADVALLERWFDRALDATSVDEVFVDT